MEKSNWFKEIIDSIRRRKSTALLMAGLVGTAAVGGAVAATRSGQDSKEERFTHVVQYAYTNMYGDLPEQNKIQTLNAGDVLSISDMESARLGGYYNVEDGEWKETDKENARIATAWIQGKVVGEDGNLSENEGFIPFEYVDVYFPYKVTKPIYFRSAPGTNAGDTTIISKAKKNDCIYILENDDEIDVDNHTWKKAVILINGEYKIGYVATDINALEQDKNGSGIGIVNTNTYLRKSPIVSELDEDIIVGQVSNGKKVRVIETYYGENDVWHNCEIEGESKPVFLSGLTVVPIQEFETYIVVQADGSKITNKAGTGVRNNVPKGSKVRVDTDHRFNGRYEVMFENDEGEITVGYMDERDLMLSPEFVSETSTTENTTEETTGTSTQRVDREEENSDKLVYQIDVSWVGTNPDAYINNIDKLQKNDELAAVYFEIGRTSCRYSNANKMVIDGFADDPTEKQMGESGDVKLIESSWAKISKEYSGNGEIVYRPNMGDIRNLEKCIKASIDRGIPVGFYYYQGAADEERASAEAAYIYSLIEKVKFDLGDAYIKAKKLPVMIDIEYTYPAAALDEARFKAVGDTIKLLGNGEDTSGCWTIEGEKGYGVLDDYNNQVTLYFDINAKNQKLGYRDSTLIQKIEELQKQGYKTIINPTRAIQASSINSNGKYVRKKYSALYSKEEMFEQMKNNKWYNNSIDLVNMSDVMQCTGDMWLGNNPFDHSLTTQKTINEIVDGTYTHDKAFFDKIQEIIDKAKQNPDITDIFRGE